MEMIVSNRLFRLFVMAYYRYIANDLKTDTPEKGSVLNIKV